MSPTTSRETVRGAEPASRTTTSSARARASCSDGRRTPSAAARRLGYKDLTVWGGRWQVDLKYTMSTDGSARFLRVQYPFFALKTPRAGGVEWRQDCLPGALVVGGEAECPGAADARDFEAWYGLRLPGEGIRTDRLIVGVFGERALFGEWHRIDGSPYPRPADRDLIGPEVGWEHQTFRWKVVQGFRSWNRQEDLPLGPNWRVTAGLSSPAFGGDRQRLRYRASFDVGRWRERTYMWAIANLIGRDREPRTGQRRHPPRAGRRDDRLGGLPAPRRGGSRSRTRRRIASSPWEPTPACAATTPASSTAVRGW